MSVYRKTKPGLVTLAPGLTLLLFLGPVAAGLIGTALPSLGYLPALGKDTFSLRTWHDIAAYPGIGDAVLRSIIIGVASALTALVITICFVARFHDTRWFATVRRALSTLLSVPHAAVAIGVLFLLSPSGWLIRLLSPWFTGWDRPPDLPLAPDPAGLTLIIALIVKEVPFLFLMVLSALSQVPAERSLTVARSLGYDRTSAWLKVVLPQIYRQLRLPFFAVLAFSLSVVDMAIILLPSPNPTLGVLILRWFHDPDLHFQLLAAAGAILQFGLVASTIAAWILIEQIVKRTGHLWIVNGNRNGGALLPGIGATGMGLVVSVGFMAPLCLAVWSFARRWRYPDAVPGSWGLETWMRHWDGFATPALTTLTVGICAAGIAAMLTCACLEAEQRSGHPPGERVLWLLYAPLLIPQAAFLLGGQVLLVHAGLDGGWIAVIWAHLLFVLPYVFLSLSEPYRALDSRFARTATCLGSGPTRTFWRIKLPMLFHAVLIAAAVGFAVSVGQYLPTVFAGGGRLATLTTEAVGLAGGGDRRIIGVYALLQALLPFAAFSLATALPRWIFRNRRAMLSGM